MMSIKLNNFALLDINTIYYDCTINKISKSNAVKSLKNANFTEKKQYHENK